MADPADYPPSGCAWCGLTAYGHARRWDWAVGWHQYEAPGQSLIKQRMLKRRGTRG